MFLEAALGDFDGVVKLLFSLSGGEFLASSFGRSILDGGAKLYNYFCLRLVLDISNLLS